MTVIEEGGQEAAKWEGQLRLLCWQRQSSLITLYAWLGWEVCIVLKPVVSDPTGSVLAWRRGSPK